MHSHVKLERGDAKHITRLPPEVEGLIISQLRDDKPALAACSVVSEPWLQQSRTFLFESVVV
ncbi:hypothetical protein K466DRAFT_502782, partial [Polyporus arcularius HHB13444]